MGEVRDIVEYWMCLCHVSMNNEHVGVISVCPVPMYYLILLSQENNSQQTQCFQNR